MNLDYEKLRKKVEERLGFTPIAKRHFEQLSEAVFETTRETISSTTLRRFWGYQEDGKQDAVRRFTLTLLARYAGYKDYDHFLSDIQHQETQGHQEQPEHIELPMPDEEHELVEQPEMPEQPVGVRRRKRYYLAAVVFLLLTFLSACAYAFISKGHHYDFEYDGLYYNVLPGLDDRVEVTYNSIDTSYEVLDVVIPETVVHDGKTYTVTAIGDSAFFNENGLIAVVLPPTIERIGASAFRDCDSLTHFNMPDAVTSIGESAFRVCRALRSIRLSSNLTELPASSFASCFVLEEIELPEDIKALRKDAFGDCVKLQRINLPEGLQTIDRGAFWQCRSLKEITLPKSVENIGDFVFWGCDSLETMNVLSPTPVRITDIFHKTEVAPHLNVPAESVDAYSKTLYWSDLEITPIVSR